jgi:hypothetical protein
MAFVAERLQGNLRLIATCRHAIWPLKEYPRVRVTINNPHPTELQIIGKPIEDTREETDIAFILVQDPKNAPTQPLVIQAADPPTIELGAILYNASAETVNPLTWQFKPYVARQVVGGEMLRTYCKMSEADAVSVPVEDIQQEKLLQQAGYISCRLLNMVSRKGYSGSPIWDNNLCLWGLDVRGSSPDQETYQQWGDVAVCLPVSELFEARQRIEPQLKELLSQI